jgi:hypothetical protein
MLQTGIEAGKWVLGHKRPLRADRIRHYLHIIASGF